MFIKTIRFIAINLVITIFIVYICIAVTIKQPRKDMK